MISVLCNSYVSIYITLDARVNFPDYFAIFKTSKERRPEAQTQRLSVE